MKDKDVPEKIAKLFHNGWRVFCLDKKNVMATLSEAGENFDVIFEDRNEQTRIVCSDVVLRDDLAESIPGAMRVGNNKIHSKTLFR